jgi:ribose-phosphate pyrophosphokinase
MTGRLLVFGGSANRELARKVCEYLNIPPASAHISRFPDGEIDVKVNEDVRGADVFVLQSTCPPVSENLMELLIMIDCLRRASADRITAVIPYYGYARQDRKAEGRVPITAKLVANMITVSGAQRVLAMDLHAAQIQGFFDIPMDHLFASPVLVEYIRRLDLADLTIVSPDIGGVKMARAYAKRLGASLAIVDKRREGPAETEVMHMVGEVKDRNVVLLDDIISTGTSIVNAVKACRDKSAKSVYICATHAVLSPGCAEKMAACGAREIAVTDTVPMPDEKRRILPGLRILSVANLLGETINRIHRAESVSQLFL